MKVLVVGGSASGKSEFAENLLVNTAGCCPLVYLATMEPGDEESQKKITRHQLLRKNKGFTTLEQPFGLSRVVPQAGSALLVECLTTLLANEMFAQGGAGTQAVEVILEDLAVLESQVDPLVVVTGELGEEGENQQVETQRYLENLGQINAQLAERFDQVVEVVCGIPLWLKGERL